MPESASELAKLRAALALAEGRAATAEAELAQARAVVSASEAMIAALTPSGCLRPSRVSDLLCMGNSVRAS